MAEMTNHPALEVLLAYFCEMNAWEADAAQHHRSLNWGSVDKEKLSHERALQRERLERVFEKYCEVGKQAKRLQDQGLSFSLGQPEHEGEVVVSVTEKSGRVIVETRETQPRGWEFRYELVQVEGEWRLRDNRKFRAQGEAKWERDLL